MVLLCARISGSIGRRSIPIDAKRPVKTALPRLAEMPHKKVALAIDRYPRTGCFLLVKYLVQSLRVEAHDYLIVNHQRGCGTTAIFINQIADGHGVKLDVSLLVLDSSSREVGL